MAGYGKRIGREERDGVGCNFLVSGCMLGLVC